MSKANKRLYKQVAAKLLDLIDSGEYPIGSRLPPERVLSERFDVSRPTIREAVIALETKGNLEVKVGSGVYVSKAADPVRILDQSVSPFELIESRVFLEGEAVALAAIMITPSQLAELAGALDEMALENLEDTSLTSSADRKFHTIISQATHNKVLKLLIEQLWDAQENLDYIRLAHRAVCMKDTSRRLSEHKAIYNALAARDSGAARTAMHNHFSRSLRALHETTEEAAVSEVKREVSRMRERFPIDRLAEKL